MIIFKKRDIYVHVYESNKMLLQSKMQFFRIYMQKH